MELIRFAFAVVAALYLISSSCTYAQNLTAVKCEGTLPTGRVLFALLYDKDDSIYLFGGDTGGTDNRYLTDVIKYSISKDTIEIAGQLPYPNYGGGAVMDKLGNIFYLSGLHAGAGIILQYFPESRTFANVSSFAESNYYFATIVPDTDTALLIGGGRIAVNASRKIVSLNLNTLETEQIGVLKEEARSPAAVWVEDEGAAYIFTAGKNTIQKYIRSSNMTETLPLEFTIPSMNNYGTVWNGQFAYVVAIHTGVIPSTRLLQFDPKTETISIIPVEGYEPVHSSSAVYIEKLNRIYIFGGSYRGIYPVEIYYIDLDPLGQPPTSTQPTTTTTTEDPPISTIDPDIFHCAGHRYSNYPYPGDCTKFVICREDQGYAFDCPKPLEFDPFDRHCTFPDKAACA